MTPQQQAALEAVNGILLTRQQLADLLVNGQAVPGAGKALTQQQLDQLEPYVSDPNNRNDVKLCELMSSWREPAVRPTPIGTGDILALMEGGGQFMNSLVALGETDADMFWAVELIKAARFDVGRKETRIKMRALAQTRPELSDAVELMLAQANVPDVLPLDYVSLALNLAEGRMVL